MLIDHMLFVQNSTREVFDIIEVFDKTTAGLAVFVDILVAIFIFVFLALMFWQLGSLQQIISLTVTNNTGKRLLYVCIPILIVLYINDVFKMMLWYWGFPAFMMTRFTEDTD